MIESVEMNKDKYNPVNFNLHTLPKAYLLILTSPKVDAYVKIDVGFQTEITIFNSASRYKSLSVQLVNPASMWWKESAEIYQPYSAYSSDVNVTDSMEAFSDLLKCKIYGSNSLKHKKCTFSW